MQARRHRSDEPAEVDSAEAAGSAPDDTLTPTLSSHATASTHSAALSSKSPAAAHPPASQQQQAAAATASGSPALTTPATHPTTLYLQKPSLGFYPPHSRSPSMTHRTLALVVSSHAPLGHGGGATADFADNLIPIARQQNHSPVQSRSSRSASSRIARIQQHLVKLSEQEHTDLERKRVAEEGKHEIQRVQAAIAAALATPAAVAPSTPVGDSLAVPLTNAYQASHSITVSSSESGSCGEDRSQTTEAKTLHAQKTKEALISFYAPKKPAAAPVATIARDNYSRTGDSSTGTAPSPAEGTAPESQVLIPASPNTQQATLLTRNSTAVVVPMSVAVAAEELSHSDQKKKKTKPKKSKRVKPGGGSGGDNDEPPVDDVIDSSSIQRASKLKKALLLFCVISLSIIILAAGLSFKQLANIRTGLREFQRSEQVSNYTSSLLESLLNGETGTRGYQITGDLVYLQPYNESLVTVPLFFGLLRAITDATDNSAFMADLDFNIKDVQDQWMTTILDRSSPVDGFDRSRLDTIRLAGKARMDSIRQLLGSVRDQEAVIVDQKYTQSMDSLTFLTVTTAITLSLIAITVVVGALIGADQESKGLHQHNQQLTVLLTKAEEATKLKSVFLANVSVHATPAPVCTPAGGGRTPASGC